MATPSIDLVFRIATTEDAPRVRSLVEAAFQTHDSRPDWTGHLELATSFRLSLEEVIKSINQPDKITLVAFRKEDTEEKDLIASIEVSHREASHAGRLSMVAVDDKYQRGGVGKKLLEYAEDYCRKEWGVTKFSLDALSTRPALNAWYQRRGYVKTGETNPFPRELEAFKGLNLPDDMCFIEMEKDFVSE